MLTKLIYFSGVKAGDLCTTYDPVMYHSSCNHTGSIGLWISILDFILNHYPRRLDWMLVSISKDWISSDWIYFQGCNIYPLHLALYNKGIRLITLILHSFQKFPLNLHGISAI